MEKSEETVELPKLFIREWLNEGQGSGYYMIEADLEADWKYDDGRCLNASVEIKDCSRQISLDFYANTPEEYQQRLVKLDKLVAALNELKAFMVSNPVVKGTIKKSKEDKKTKVLSAEEFLQQLEEETTDAGKSDVG